MNLTARHIVPLILALFVGGPLAWIVFYRADVVTYDGFRLEPAVITSAQEANLVMSVTWSRPKCEVTVQTMVWTLDGKQSFPIGGPYVAKVQNGARILIDKPRKVQMPILPPGDYLIGFSEADARCWGWESTFPIKNTPPKPSRFTVRAQ